MPYPRIQPEQIETAPLAERESFIDIRRIAIDPDAPPQAIEPALQRQIDELADRMRSARQRDAAVVLTYGAHLVKNGCAPLVNRLIQRGWVTALATQGAGVIHDWEFAFQGLSSESVRENAAVGRFGAWNETGEAIIGALVDGAAADLGFGESLGRRINDQAERHPFREYSITATAQQQGVPLCVMPGVGYDIYVCHPQFTEQAGAALGRCATRDFHTFCQQVRNLSGGVYLSVGSAIMSPQVFEKAYAIANNLRRAAGEPYLQDHHIAIVDLQDGGGWDWSRGEPPMDHPAYYLRFCKSFYRTAQGPAGDPDRGSVAYLQADNRTVLHHLVQSLET